MAPEIGPVASDSRLQFMPNSNASTTPETTPRPNVTPNILSQNSNKRRYTGLAVIMWSASSTVNHAASPIVNDGKIM